MGNYRQSICITSKSKLMKMFPHFCPVNKESLARIYSQLTELSKSTMDLDEGHIARRSVKIPRNVSLKYPVQYEARGNDAN